MDLNRLLQGVGGRMLRRFLGTALKQGIERMGRTGQGAGTNDELSKQDSRRRADQTRATQKRMNDLIKIGRRFWK